MSDVDIYNVHSPNFPVKIGDSYIKIEHEILESGKVDLNDGRIIFIADIPNTNNQIIIYISTSLPDDDTESPVFFMKQKNISIEIPEHEKEFLNIRNIMMASLLPHFICYKVDNEHVKLFSIHVILNGKEVTC